MNDGWISTRLARRLFLLGAGCYLVSGLLLLVVAWDRMSATNKAEAQSPVGTALQVAPLVLGQNRTTVDDYQITGIGTSTVGRIIYVGDVQEFSASLGNIELIAESGTGKANIHAEK